MHNVEPSDFELLAGENFLHKYQFNTKTVDHYFCKRCGIFTFFHSRYGGEDVYVVNVGCLEGVDPYSMQPRLVDGIAY